MSKPRKIKKIRRLRVGDHVVAEGGTLEAASPVDRLIVTRTHKSDGTVDLEATTGIAWERVDPRLLLTVP